MNISVPVHPLVPLVCGLPLVEGIAKAALEQLARSIENFSAKATSYLGQAVIDDILSFGPFCARVLLENSCAAVLGRLDCFRLLYLSEFQSQPRYETGKRAKSAFSWTGDVIPEERANDIWSMDNDLNKISRALLSKHLDHVYWKPAVNKMLDHLATLPANPSLAEINDIDADTFVDQIKGRSTQLYSSLSKGVHWEFFSSSLTLDEITVKNDLRETLLLVASLGLVSNFIPTAYASMSPTEAVNKYLELRRLVP